MGWETEPRKPITTRVYCSLFCKRCPHKQNRLSNGTEQRMRTTCFSGSLLWLSSFVFAPAGKNTMLTIFCSITRINPCINRKGFVLGKVLGDFRCLESLLQPKEEQAVGGVPPPLSLNCSVNPEYSDMLKQNIYFLCWIYAVCMAWLCTRCKLLHTAATQSTTLFFFSKCISSSVSLSGRATFCLSWINARTHQLLQSNLFNCC